MATCAECGAELSLARAYCSSCRDRPLASPAPARSDAAASGHGISSPRVARSSFPPFVEPTTRLALRYGRYRPRYLLALVLLLGGGLVLQLASVYTLPLLGAGAAASLAGWIVVPCAGWRRTTATVPGLLGAASVLNGAQSGALVALSLVCWLLVRHRPLRSFVVVVIPVGAALLSAPTLSQYSDRPAVAAILTLAIVVAAWAGRSLAAWHPGRLSRIFQVRRRIRPVK